MASRSPRDRPPPARRRRGAAAQAPWMRNGGRRASGAAPSPLPRPAAVAPGQATAGPGIGRHARRRRSATGDPVSLRPGHGQVPRGADRRPLAAVWRAPAPRARAIAGPSRPCCHPDLSLPRPGPGGPCRRHPVVQPSRARPPPRSRRSPQFSIPALRYRPSPPPPGAAPGPGPSLFTTAVIASRPGPSPLSTLPYLRPDGTTAAGLPPPPPPAPPPPHAAPRAGGFRGRKHSFEASPDSRYLDRVQWSGKNGLMEK